jgi:hypothetical protein
MQSVLKKEKLYFFVESCSKMTVQINFAKHSNKVHDHCEKIEAYNFYLERCDF